MTLVSVWALFYVLLAKAKYVYDLGGNQLHVAYLIHMCWEGQRMQ